MPIRGVCIYILYIYLLLALNTLLHVWQRFKWDGYCVVLLLWLLMTLMILLGNYRSNDRASLRHPGLRSHLRFLSTPRIRSGPGQLNGGLLWRDAGVSGRIPRRVPAMQRRSPFFVDVSLWFVLSQSSIVQCFMASCIASMIINN